MKNDKRKNLCRGLTDEHVKIKFDNKCGGNGHKWCTKMLWSYSQILSEKGNIEIFETGILMSRVNQLNLVA